MDVMVVLVFMSGGSLCAAFMHRWAFWYGTVLSLVALVACGIFYLNRLDVWTFVRLFILPFIIGSFIMLLWGENGGALAVYMMLGLVAVPVMMLLVSICVLWAAGSRLKAPN